MSQQTYLNRCVAAALYLDIKKAPAGALHNKAAKFMEWT